ncbi:carbohydrate ABC transporter permease [Aquabacterium sp. OR-4]|uniref:carbohydrate ABC transporter permease n=1 Tax=Aquabacterium sp. OR-4 TaxID=2978127 RepID=UPI0021B1FC07|nr:carbohydrate ABC transporter permease [Aquabacterium sp. OR-4]MDT7838011.1 carbohydrate ABC transporter permease [Aquabacterium sp. OR-4]
MSRQQRGPQAEWRQAQPDAAPVNAPLRGGLTDRLLLALAVLLAVAWTLPLAWVLALSFKSNADLMERSDALLSSPFTLANYADIVAHPAVFQWVLNSAVVAVVQTVLVLLLSSLAGYGFARCEFPGRRWLFALVLAGLAVPEPAVVIPLHRLFAQLDLHNTYAGLVLPRLAAPFGVFMMVQFFKAIPRELEEAALLDNASRWTVFWRVILPLTLPAQATLGIFSFLACWNDYLWPLISATRPEMYTLTLGLASTQSNFAQSEGLGFLMAQAVFAALPMLVLYAFFQRHIVAAVAGGGAVREAAR